jgi:hypothetical protein
VNPGDSSFSHFNTMFENAKQPVSQKYPRLRSGKVNGEAYRGVAGRGWGGLASKIFG